MWKTAWSCFTGKALHKQAVYSPAHLLRWRKSLVKVRGDRGFPILAGLHRLLFLLCCFDRHPTLFLSLPALLSSCPPPQKPDDVQAPQSRTFKRYHYHFKEPAAVLQTYKPWYAIAIATNCVITLYCFIAKWWPAPACYTCQTVGGQCSVAIRKKKSMLCASAIVAADPVKHRCFLSVFQTKACFGFFLLLSITWQIWSREGLQASEDTH